MKIKSLLMGMAAFLGFALAGCSDDVIDVNNQEQQVSNEPAYLSVSFSGSSTSSRSTADDANNQGDKNGDQEHSGHINLGTEGENAVINALVVVKSTQQGVKGYARLYGDNTDAEDDYGVGIEKGVLNEGSIAGEKVYTAGEPIELTANTFEVLVVANPYAGLISGFEKSLGTGTYDDAVVDALFTKITTGQYGYTTTTQPASYNFAGEIVSFEGEDNNLKVKGIMMANKELPQIKLAPGQEQSIEIPIERVASKITFRITNGNVYPIEVPKPETVKMDVVEANVDGQEGNEKLNHYTYDNKDYYIVVDNDKNFISAYTKDETGSYTQTNELTANNFSEATPVYTYEKDTWYVKLEKYALVNLAKSVYNVRHIIEGNEEGKAVSGAEVVPFEKLDGTNFLYTPLWETANNGISGINAVEFNETTGLFSNIENTDAWFFNTLQKVSDESDAVYSANKSWTYFTDLKSSYTDTDSDGNVIAGGNTSNQTQHTEQLQNLVNIGYPLAYCLENSTDVDHQTHGLSTGITFMARIFSDEACETNIKAMYRYKGYAFSSIENITEAFPNDTNLNGLTENSNPTAFETAGVTRYDGNTCYYYTTEIKHFDNNIYPELGEDGNMNQSLGNMEFAIMRNNIYSLAVTAIEKIGDPYVDPIPSTPDEIAKPKLTVEAKIMPWIVRYHDIEF